MRSVDSVCLHACHILVRISIIVLTCTCLFVLASALQKYRDPYYSQICHQLVTLAINYKLISCTAAHTMTCSFSIVKKRDTIIYSWTLQLLQHWYIDKVDYSTVADSIEFYMDMYMYAHVCSGLTTHTYASIRESYDYQNEISIQSNKLVRT